MISLRQIVLALFAVLVMVNAAAGGREQHAASKPVVAWQLAVDEGATSVASSEFVPVTPDIDAVGQGFALPPGYDSMGKSFRDYDCPGDRPLCSR